MTTRLKEEEMVKRNSVNVGNNVTHNEERAQCIMGHPLAVQAYNTIEYLKFRVTQASTNKVHPTGRFYDQSKR